jgi:hypothetical protein
MSALKESIKGCLLIPTFLGLMAIGIGGIYLILDDLTSDPGHPLLYSAILITLLIAPLYGVAFRFGQRLCKVNVPLPETAIHIVWDEPYNAVGRLYTIAFAIFIVFDFVFICGMALKLSLEPLSTSQRWLWIGGVLTTGILGCMVASYLGQYPMENRRKILLATTWWVPMGVTGFLLYSWWVSPPMLTFTEFYCFLIGAVLSFVTIMYMELTWKPAEFTSYEPNCMAQSTGLLTLLFGVGFIGAQVLIGIELVMITAMTWLYPLLWYMPLKLWWARPRLHKS